MQNALYHREVYLPSELLNLKQVTKAISATAHALKAAEEDRYGKIEIPSSVTFSGKNIVEAEVLGGRLVKILVRVPYDAERDLLLALAVPEWRAKTVWFNLKSDIHRTLDKSKYSQK